MCGCALRDKLLQQSASLCFIFLLFGLEGCASARRQHSKKGGRKKKGGGVKGGEGEESTPKLVPAGPQREVPLLFKVSSKGVGQIRETP